ncbi:MAG: choice-of-anchor B family protein [Colwellia sp.]|nr:choice-of-anchor B family protein [Colwellia sp.]
MTKFKVTAPLTLLLFSLFSQLTFAHAEHDKARFVSPTGLDKGKCDNVLRPCQSIVYAVQQANKGDKVLVSSGKYLINSSAELFYLKSEIVPVLGGYNRFDHFQSQSPDNNVTTLLGVPSELVDNLRMKGFAVIADGKSQLFDEDLQQKLRAYKLLSQKQTNEACIDNLAGSFECNNIDLLAHIPLGDFSSSPRAANDIWGHVDLNNGAEYALIGLDNGIAVVNVTEPTNPVEVGTISGKTNIWRDIKVYQYFDSSLNLWRAYAYATIDGSSDNLTIINLNHLPNSISLVQKSTVVTQAHNVYITNVDHTLNIALPGVIPTLQLTGANTFAGAFHSYSLTDPENITLLSAKSAGSGYSHDGASLLISDDRKVTDCQTTAETCSVFLDFNEKELKLWNISDASSAKLLGLAEYNDVSKENTYVHSGWGSEDKQYVFLHDEFDEYKGGLNSTVRIFSISDLTNPQQVGQWTGSTRAIDHNGFVRGNRYYLSNYERGLTVLDISDPTNPTEIGYFDTFTPSNSASFNGAWGAYPFLPSGNILISDINSGLYVLKDNTLDSSQGKLSFSQKNITAAQGETLQISVQRIDSNNTAGSVTVGYEILSGSASPEVDYTVSTGILSWSDNDDSPQSIAIPIAEDPSGEEFSESFYVRLFNPTNGATIASPSYITVNIAGQINNGAASFIQSEVLFAENQQNISIEVSRDGNTSGELSVTYQMQSGSALVGQDVEDINGTLTWLDDEADNKVINITLIDDDTEEPEESFTLLLEANSANNLGINSIITVRISDDDTNTAPVVNITENFEVNTGQTVTLTSTVTDAENDELSYLWQQDSGETVSLNDADKLSANFVAPSVAGSLGFTLTATDNKGSAGSDTITVSVIQPAFAIVTPPAKKSNGGSQGMLILLLVILFLIKQFRLEKGLT